MRCVKGVCFSATAIAVPTLYRPRLVVVEVLTRVLARNGFQTCFSSDRRMMSPASQLCSTHLCSTHLD